MPVAVFCHAPEDGSIARELAHQVSTTTAFACERHILDDGETLLDCYDRGADATILLTSPHSVPARPDRAQWQPVLDYDAAIAAFEAAPAAIPGTLRHKKLVTSDVRRLRQWLLSLIALEPRLAGVPRDFPIDDPDDYERVLYVDAAGRSLHGIAGDLAWRLNLDLPHNLERNLAALRSHCARHSYLVIVAGAEAPLDLGPLTTVVNPPSQTPAENPEDLLRAPADHAALAAIERTFRASGHPVLGQRAVTLATQLGRLAEAYEFLCLLRANASLAPWIERESAWITDFWDGKVHVPTSNPLTEGTQLTLGF
ncbi:MAG: hypothetical protein SFV54_16460 [Bryobacteraceae bacterium]|nr:hypothetical protein [Bryobacteraceae bacterium]